MSISISIIIFVELGVHSIDCFIVNARHVGNKIMDVSIFCDLGIQICPEKLKEDNFF